MKKLLITLFVLLALLASILNSPAPSSGGSTGGGSVSTRPTTNIIDTTAFSYDTWITNSSGSNLVVNLAAAVAAAPNGSLSLIVNNGDVKSTNKISANVTATIRGVLVGFVNPGGSYYLGDGSNGGVESWQRIYSPLGGAVYTVSSNTTNTLAGAVTNAVYISPTGSDSDAGTIVAPMATLQAAAIRLGQYGGKIVCADGTYTNQYLFVTNAPFANYEIVAIARANPKFECQSNLVSSTSFSVYSGATYVATVTGSTAADLLSWTNLFLQNDSTKAAFIFEYKRPAYPFWAEDKNSIPPWQMNWGNSNRLEHGKLLYMANKASLTNGSFAVEGNQLYVKFSDGGSPVSIVFPAATPYFIQVTNGQTLKLSGLRSYFYNTSFLMGGASSEAEKCYAFGAWSVGFTAGLGASVMKLLMCEGAANYSAGASTGINELQYSEDSCWWHDGERQGSTHHFGVVATVRHSYSTWNNKYGYSAFGSISLLNNCVSAYNKGGGFWLHTADYSTNKPPMMVLNSCRSWMDTGPSVSQALGDGGNLIANNCELSPKPATQLASANDNASNGSGVWLNNCWTAITNPVQDFLVTSSTNIYINGSDAAYQPIIGVQGRGLLGTYPNTRKAFSLSTNGVDLMLDPIRGESLSSTMILTNEFYVTNSTGYPAMPWDGYWNCRPYLTTRYSKWKVDCKLIWTTTNSGPSMGLIVWQSLTQNSTNFWVRTRLTKGSTTSTVFAIGHVNALTSDSLTSATSGMIEIEAIWVPTASSPPQISLLLQGIGANPFTNVFLRAGSTITITPIMP